MAWGKWGYFIYSFNKSYEYQALLLFLSMLGMSNANKIHVLMEHIFMEDYSSYKYTLIDKRKSGNVSTKAITKEGDVLS